MKETKVESLYEPPFVESSSYSNTASLRAHIVLEFPPLAQKQVDNLCGIFDIPGLPLTSHGTRACHSTHFDTCRLNSPQQLKCPHWRTNTGALVGPYCNRDATGQGNQGSQGKVREKKQDWKSGKSQGIRSQVRKKSGNFDPQHRFFPPINCQKPWGLRRKKSGKNEKFGRKSGKSQGISLLDSCSNPVAGNSVVVVAKLHNSRSILSPDYTAIRPLYRILYRPLESPEIAIKVYLKKAVNSVKTSVRLRIVDQEATEPHKKLESKTLLKRKLEEKDNTAGPSYTPACTRVGLRSSSSRKQAARGRAVVWRRWRGDLQSCLGRDVDLVAVVETATCLFWSPKYLWRLAFVGEKAGHLPFRPTVVGVLAEAC
ncbi:hypothetical protein J6590_061657 [Homalodisca vitripennis]|nr:hypothetical protein J6590_061657 [Homalodisca vitripennis]